LGIQTEVSKEYDFIFGLNSLQMKAQRAFETSPKFTIAIVYIHIPEYCDIILLTHPLSHLLFHEGHEQIEHSHEGWFHVDMIYTFGSNGVAILEQRIYLQDHFRTTVTTKILIVHGQYVNVI
jgi:hypothetical protein